MASKFKIEFYSGEVIETGSLSALILRLTQEQEKWQELFPTQSITQRGLSNVEAKYQNAISFTKGHPWGDRGSDQTLRLQLEHRIFPLFESIVGARVREMWAADLMFEAASLISYWQMLNRWREKSEMLRNDANASFLRLGAAIYWSIVSTESVIKQLNKSRNLAAEQERIQNAISELEHDVKSAREKKLNFDDFIASERVRVAEKFTQINRVALMGVRKAKSIKLDWLRKFEATHEHFVHKLQYEAPVKLWTRTEETHQRRAVIAIRWFVAILLSTVVCCGIIVIFLGDDIAATFYRMSCTNKNSCVEVFSAKGPLTVGSLLLSASLAIWGLRFSSKLYLSERHLAIGAAERKAFTESYLALVSDQVISSEQEAIVLAALFRPSSDGVIKDDDGGLDISAATILAKALSGPVAKP